MVWWKGPVEDTPPDHLVDSVMAADVFPETNELTLAGEEGRRMQAAGLLELFLRLPQAFGQSQESA